MKAAPKLALLFSTVFLASCRPSLKQVRMKAAPKLALLFSTVFLAVCYLLLNGGIFSENLNAVSVEEPVNFSADATKDVKSILVWNNAWRHETAVFGSGDDIFSVQGCLESRCRLYVEREALPFHQYDALVFHGYNIPWVTFNALLSALNFVWVRREDEGTIYYLK